MKAPKNFIERFAYSLKTWQALIMIVIPAFFLIVLLCYMGNKSIYNIGLVLTCIFLFSLQIISSYIVALQSAYKILKGLYRN